MSFGGCGLGSAMRETTARPAIVIRTSSAAASRAASRAAKRTAAFPPRDPSVATRIFIGSFPLSRAPAASFGSIIQQRVITTRPPRLMRVHQLKGLLSLAVLAAPRREIRSN